MQLTRRYDPASIQWETLPELPARLARHDITIRTVSVSLDSCPDSIEIDDLRQASDRVAAGFVPHGYSVVLRGKLGDNNFSLHLFRKPDSDNIVILNGSLDSAILDSVSAFLGLKPHVHPPTEAPPTSPARSVFIAHRFDDMGSACSEKIARFLGLLDFRVVSGRGFSPVSVAEKVRTRLKAQAVVLVLLTPGDDTTWLIQESVLAEALSKPLLLLRDSTTEFKPALLADREYIPFTAPHIETTYSSLLEGLRELGYRFR